MQHLGLILTSATSITSVRQHLAALPAATATLKVVTGWGLPWSPMLRHDVLRLAPTTIVRTVHGDPSVRGGAHQFPHPEHIAREIRPWYVERDPARAFYIELGNEPLLAPEPDDQRAHEYSYYLRRAIGVCRAQFPAARLIAPAHLVNHPIRVGGAAWGQGRWLQVQADVYRECDAVGIHAYSIEQIGDAADLVRDAVGDVPLVLTEFALNERLDPAARGERYAAILRSTGAIGATLYHLDELGGADPVHFNPHYALDVATLRALRTAWEAPVTPPAPPRPPVTSLAMSREHLTRGRTRGPISALVLHATGGRHPHDLAWLRQGGSAAAPVSCHYYISKAGATSQLVADHDTAWHAGVSMWRGLEVYQRTADGRRVPSLNPVSLGIELENANTGRDPYPELQVRAAVALSRHLVHAHRIPRAHLVRHLDIAPGRKTDPAGFPWERFVVDVYEGL